MRGWLALAALAGLPACSEGLSLGLLSNRSEPQVTSATVTRSNVVVNGPYGFCVDPVSTSGSGQKAFVVFGNCAAITRANDAAQPFADAVAFVSVTALDDPDGTSSTSAEALRDFLVSEPGKATLSRSGKPGTIEVFDSFATSQSVFIHFRDTSPGGAKGMADAYWRGFRMISDAAVAVSVVGLEGQPLSPALGLDLVRDFVSRLAIARGPDETVDITSPEKTG